MRLVYRTLTRWGAINNVPLLLLLYAWRRIRKKEMKHFARNSCMARFPSNGIKKILD